jgi:hypothetical protein
VYGLVAMDDRSRLSDRAVLRDLGWTPGTPLAVRVEQTVAVRCAPNRPGSDCAVPARCGASGYSPRTDCLLHDLRPDHPPPSRRDRPLANVYTGGTSEKSLGELLAGRRDRFVVATKYTSQYTSQQDPTDPNSAGNHRKNLRTSIEASLHRLQTGYIDVRWAALRL